MHYGYHIYLLPAQNRCKRKKLPHLRLFALSLLCRFLNFSFNFLSLFFLFHCNHKTMVQWLSLAVSCLALPLIQAFELPNQLPFSVQFKHKQDALEHANKLLSRHPVIDTHNDLPM